jgi:BolA protein
VSGETVNLLQQRLTAALQPTALAIRDDTHLHAGHVGARSGGGHYHIDIVAAAFAGKNTVARHRMIYDAAGELMRGPVHALSINAKAVGEV